MLCCGFVSTGGRLECNRGTVPRSRQEISKGSGKHLSALAMEWSCPSLEEISKRSCLEEAGKVQKRRLVI